MQHAVAAESAEVESIDGIEWPTSAYRRLGVSRSTLYRWVLRGWIQPVTVLGRRAFRRRDVDELIALRESLPR